MSPHIPAAGPLPAPQNKTAAGHPCKDNDQRQTKETVAMSIPTVEVRGTYLMDPETEDLIYGDELREGMVVLIEDALIGRSSFSGSRDLESLRWCRVTRLKHDDLHDSDDFGRHVKVGTVVRFIGVYSDDSKFSRSYNESYAWFVKLDSIGGAA